MFLPFTQGSADKSGLGLGLSIAQRVVEANQGTLSVRDQPGSGCVFTIDLASLRDGGLRSLSDGLRDQTAVGTSLRRMASCSGASMPILIRRPVPPRRVIWIGPLAKSCAMVMLQSTPSAGWITMDSSARRLKTNIYQARASARSVLVKVFP